MRNYKVNLIFTDFIFIAIQTKVTACQLHNRKYARLLHITREWSMIKIQTKNHYLDWKSIVKCELCMSTGSSSSEDNTTCLYEGQEYPAGAKVPTTERCLSCRCGDRGGAPLCRLQVCPELPVPPPRGCVLVHRRGECCQRLVCGE